MLPESLLGTAAMIGLVAAFWAKLKALVWRATGLLIVRFTVSHELEWALRSYLCAHAKPFPLAVRNFSGSSLFVRPVGSILSVAYEYLGSTGMAYFIGRRFLWVAGGSTRRGEREIQISPGESAEHSTTVSYVRGTFSTDALVRAAVDYYNETVHSTGRPGAGPKSLSGSRYQVVRVTGMGKLGMGFSGERGKTLADSDDTFGSPVSRSNTVQLGVTYLHWTRDELGEPRPDDPFEFLAYPPEGRAVLADVEWWINSRDEYKSRGVPWRMGIALTGPPGTGKSSLCRAVAQKYDLPVYAIELSTMTDGELIRAWRKAKAMSPSVVLIEDVDTVFDGRTLVEGGPEGLSFGVLLNCLSGVEEADGVLVFITTNRPETLDPALGAPDPETGQSTRPGRIDRVVHLGPMDEAGRRYLAGRILRGEPQEIEALVAAGDGATGAQFQQQCIQRAFELIRAKREEAVTCPREKPTSTGTPAPDAATAG